MINRRRVLGLWHRLDVTLRDLPLALVFLAGSLIPSLHGHGTEVGDLPDRPFDELAAVSLLLQCLPFALRRRWPIACLTLVSLGFALDQLRGYHMFAGTMLALTLVSTGANLDRHRRATMLALTAAYVPLSVGLYLLGPGLPSTEFITFYLALALAWGIGSWLRSTRVAEAERRRRVAASTRTAERERIARDLHDVVTHHVTAMVVQAEAARYLTAAPDRLDEALGAVTDTGRRAISDLRHLLDVLNPDHGTDSVAPPVGDIDKLVEQTRRAGQPVEFTEEGIPAAETVGGADFVAYSVVQEALTNALKYAHGSRTSVWVHRGAREINVEISTDGPGAQAGSPGGSGRGLAGLRARVEAVDGDFDAGPHTGGFVVRARIPGGSAL